MYNPWMMGAFSSTGLVAWDARQVAAKSDNTIALPTMAAVEGPSSQSVAEQ